MSLHDNGPDALAARAEAAFLGLALGDAYGRSLEFVLLPEVRSTPVVVRSGSFRWTDDTHMSLYLAQAVADLPVQPGLDEDALGRAIGRRFAEWAEDPLTPSTAPGNTCLRGARAFARHGDWQRSGDRGSDGCGAVMRIVPIALAFDGRALIDAARVSAIVTHAHPNAVEAAIAGAWLCREVIRRGRLDTATVTRAIGHLRRDWAWGGEVAESLEAALDQVEGAVAEVGDDLSDSWLSEESMPPGDGGWRSGSALGLAVVAALRWGRLGFATVVEKAARIEGDSDSVAALAGMLVGAARGPAALPTAWLEALPSRAEIAETARRLWRRGAATAAAVQANPLEQEPTDESEQAEPDSMSAAAVDESDTASVRPVPALEGQGSKPSARSRLAPPVQLTLTGPPPPAEEDSSQLVPPPWTGPALRPRSSIDHPLRMRWLDLAMLGPRAPRGRIGLCAVPGRRDTETWDRNLGVDLDRLVSLHRVDHLVVLLDAAESAALGVSALAAEAEARRIVVHPLPIAPGAAPPLDRAEAAVSLMLAVARAGRRIVLTSRDGEERAGTLATAALVALGLAPDAALRSVRATVGPRAASSDAQRSFVHTLPAPLR